MHLRFARRRARARTPRANGAILLGRLRIPGEILLFEQPLPPWTLPGRLRQSEADRLARAGARVEVIGGGAQTVVAWPGQTLRDFILTDVLIHELGHHVVQQYTGKRTARVRRTKDHEAFAVRFAARHRARHLAGRRAP